MRPLHFLILLFVAAIVLCYWSWQIGAAIVAAIVLAFALMFGTLKPEATRELHEGKDEDDVGPA